jgi:hypothetical protein
MKIRRTNLLKNKKKQKIKKNTQHEKKQRKYLT